MTKRIFLTATIILAITATAVATGTQEGTGTDNVGFNASGYPIVDQQIELTIMAPRRPQVTKPYNEMAIIREITEETNILVNWDLTSDEDWTTRVSLAFASGDYPDAFYGRGAIIDVPRYGMQEKVLPPLNDLIEEFAPNLNKIFQEYPSHKAEVTYPDGNIYAMPQGEIDDGLKILQHGMIRVDWLDRLGLDVPTTTEELRSVLRAIRDGDANGDGDPDNEIPLSFLFTHAVMGEYPIYGFFGVVSGGGWGWTSLEGGEVVFAPTLDGFKDAIRYMHELYAEGLIDPESFTHDRSVFLAKIRNTGVGYQFGWSPYLITTDRDPTGIVETIPPMRAYDDVDPVWPSNHVAARPNAGLILTTANEYPEATVRWGDWWYEPMNSIRAQKGYDIVRVAADGSISFAPPEDTPAGLTFGEWELLDTPGVNSLHFLTAGMINSFPRAPDFQFKYELQEKNYREYAGPAWPNPIFSEEENEVMQLYDTDINSFVDNRVAEWIVNGTMDDTFEGFMQEVRRLGLDEWLAARNAAYQRFVNAQ